MLKSRLQQTSPPDAPVTAAEALSLRIDVGILGCSYFTSFILVSSLVILYRIVEINLQFSFLPYH